MIKEYDETILLLILRIHKNTECTRCNRKFEKYKNNDRKRLFFHIKLKNLEELLDALSPVIYC
jgi:hypothetical protein